MRTIKKPIMTKLSKRFNISDESGQLILSDYMFLTTDADSLSRTLSSSSVSASAVSAADVYTCPFGKSWIIRVASINRANTATGSVTITPLATGTAVPVTTFASGVNPQVLFFTIELRLYAGDKITINADTAASGSIITYILYEEEDF